MASLAPRDPYRRRPPEPQAGPLVALALILALLVLVGVNIARAHTTPRPAPERVLRSVFDDRWRSAYRVAYCETGGTFNPRATGRAGERGWLQIHPVHFGRTLRYKHIRIRVNARRLYEPLYNARVGYVLSRGGTDWSPWTCRP